MKNPLLVPELRDNLAKNNFHALKEFAESAHPVSVAEFLSALTASEIWKILALADPMVRGEIFCQLDEDVQLEMAETLRRQELALLVSDMPPDDRVDLLKRIPEDRREAILPALAQAEREDIRRLSSYEEGTAGAVMTSDYAVLTLDLTAAEAIDKLRKEAPNKETGYCAWAVAQGYTAEIDPEAWKIVGGKLYLNYSKDVQKKWEQDIPGNIEKADQNWPGVLD
jgi:magnesium transporter